MVKFIIGTICGHVWVFGGRLGFFFFQFFLHPLRGTMWDRRRRALLLWSPIAWVIATTFWLKRLKRARAVRAFEARERFLLQSEDVGLNPEVQGEENEAFDVNGPQNYKLHDSEVMQPLLISIVSLSRTIAAWFLVLNLISNEIASLYCNGHTGTHFCLHSCALKTRKSQTNEIFILCL